MRILGCILVLVSQLVGCGREEEPMVPEFDADLTPSMERYLALAPDRGRMPLLATVSYGELPGIGGYCADVEGYYHITVNAVFKEKDRIFKDVVVAHEMGHCVHGLTHTEDPESLMYGGTFHITRDREMWEAELDNKIKALFES
jgi:hypothetical protein